MKLKIMTEKSQGKIIVGNRGDNPVLCFSVEDGKGTSGSKKQFVDIEVTPEQLKELSDSIEKLQAENE